MHWPENLTKRIQLETHFDNRQIKCFAQRPANLNVIFSEALQRNPDGEAVVCGPDRLSYLHLDTGVSELAAGLLARGINQGDRIAVLVSNRIEFLQLLLASSRIGAITVPINIREQTPELTYILNHCGAKLLVHDHDLDSKIPSSSALELLTLRFSLDGATENAEDFTTLYKKEEDVTPVQVNEEDVAVILFTSGTTGRPKGAMLTHFNIVHSVMHFELCMALREHERSLLAVPASHVTGIVAVLGTMLRVAGCTVMMPTFEASEFLQLAERERITHTLQVPAMYNLLLLRCRLADFDLRTWRIGGYGGALMPQSTISRLAEELPQLLLINAYGATEVTSPATMSPPGTGTSHADSVGIAMPCADIRVVDESGIDVPAGQHGELWIGGPMTVPGYWNNEEKSCTEFHQGYWRSGDIGSRDAQGFFHLHDRRKDMIIRGGYNIYSAEIENVVTAIDGVIECAAIGRPDSVLGEKTLLVVHTQSPKTVTKELVISHCRDNLADYKVPDFVEFSGNPLPRNANGKVIKTALREKAATE